MSPNSSSVTARGGRQCDLIVLGRRKCRGRAFAKARPISPSEHLVGRPNIVGRALSPLNGESLLGAHDPAGPVGGSRPQRDAVSRHAVQSRRVILAGCHVPYFAVFPERGFSLAGAFTCGDILGVRWARPCYRKGSVVPIIVETDAERS